MKLMTGLDEVCMTDYEYVAELRPVLVIPVNQE